MNTLNDASRTRQRRRILLAMDMSAAGPRRIGIAQYAHEAGWVLDSGLFALIPEGQHKHYLEGIEFDGILSSLHTSQPQLRKVVESAGVPVVDLGQGIPDLKIPRVIPDHRVAGELAARHLLDLGLRKLLFYSHHIRHPAAEARRDGFRDAAAARGVVIEELWWEGFGEELVPTKRLTWLARKLKDIGHPLGVMAQNDLIAADVFDAAMRAELRIPEDVAVMGVDNDPVAAELGLIPLTSVDMARERIGYEAAALLDRLMKGQRAPKTPTLVQPAGVVVRQSTQMLAVSDPNLSAAVRFIRENFRQTISVEDVAAVTFLSRRRLQDLFHDTFGHGMNDEIARQRLEFCKRLLTQTTHKISSIAIMAGFGDVNRMGKTFKRKLKMAPDEYRQKYQGALVQP